MSRIEESAANKAFPAKFTPKGIASAPYFRSSEKPGASAGRRVPAGNGDRAGATSGCCPCCGAVLQNQQLAVDLNSNTVLYGDVAIRLQPTEAELLSVLARRAPGVVTHDTLIAALWGLDEPTDPTKNIQVQICRLRKRLSPLGVAIVNVMGVGYRLRTGAN